MNLISKQKTVDYIAQYPEAKTALLIWVMEFDYVQSKLLEERSREHPPWGILNCSGSLNKAGYSIEYLVNPWYKTGVVTWFGTEAERIAYHAARIEKYKAANPGHVLVTKSITIKRTSRAKAQAIKLPDEANKPPLANDVKEMPTVDYHSLALYTDTEYKQAVERAIAIFAATPGTAEFEELAVLLPLIGIYERETVSLPKPKIQDVIKLKMDICGLDIPLLSRKLQESEENITLFFDGKKVLTPSRMKRLFTYFRMGYALADSGFFD